MAKQARKPSGLFAKKVGENMNKVNEIVYVLTLEAMRLEDGDAVLEIGFCNGKFFEKIFSIAKNLKISGIDFSKEMVKIASKNNQSFIANGKLNLQYASSDNIPFADNSFDKVFCINVVYFWEQPPQHLKEIYRVLKPGGKFYATLRSKETVLRLPFTKYGFTAYDEREWRKILEDNNFKYAGCVEKNEPDIRVNGKNYKYNSWCLIAQKPS